MASILFDNYLIISVTWLAGLTGVVSNFYIIIKCIFKLKKLPITSGTKPIPDPKSSILVRRYIFYILMINMAIGDALGSFYLVILAIADIRYRLIQLPSTNSSSIRHGANFSTAIELFTLWLHNPMCHLARFIHYLSITHSISMTGFIAIDRFIRLKYAFKINIQITKKILVIISIFPWMISVPHALTGIILAKNTTIHSTSVIIYEYHNLCSYDNLEIEFIKIYLLISMLLGMLVYVMVFMMYLIIVYNIGEVKQHQLFITTRFKDRKSEYVILTTAIMITVTNFITWFPAFVVGMIIVFNPEFIGKNESFIIISSVFVVLFQSNCALNPLILIYNTKQRYNKVKLALG